MHRMGAHATRFSISLVTVLGAIGLMAGPATALATTPSSSPTDVRSSSGLLTLRDASNQAREIAAEARALRRDVSAALAEYESAFAGQLSAADRQTLTSFSGDADRRLAAVVRETTALEAAAAGSSRARVTAARARSQAAWARAQQAAEVSFESARSILEPQMSLLERVRALSDYSMLMTRFEDLGESIDTFTTN